ncbi:MAG TPA: PAS domain S-box protein, partial [Polyangia bacterium]|nr:PAS domain S-box protein [Polyangia bacterium]
MPARPTSERKGQDRDRRLLDTMPQCIWAADAQGRVNYWNRAGLEYCGLAAADLTDGSFWEVLHADDREEARAHWERGLHGEPTFERQVRLRRASDGNFRWHLVRAVAERDDDGTVIGWIATATDIDDQKRAEAELRAAVVLRDDFLSVASHELRTPLTALKLEVSNLLRLARLDAGGERARLIAKVERIDAQAAR